MEEVSGRFFYWTVGLLLGWPTYRRACGLLPASRPSARVMSNERGPYGDAATTCDAADGAARADEPSGSATGAGACPPRVRGPALPQRGGGDRSVY
jgi:hypothetical protein